MNLLIVVSDTFRWDYLGACGNDWIQTPNLDRLASESAVFLHAYAEGLPTLPARRVIKTGRNVFPFAYRPQSSDMVQLEGWHPLFDEDVTLAEHLGKHGYYSAFITDVYHMMKPGKDFHRGYNCWHWIRGQEGDAYKLTDPDQVRELLGAADCYDQGPLGDDHWVVQHLMNRKDWTSEADTSVARVMLRAGEWLRQYTLDDPFFMYVDCFDPHEPWDPPLEYARRYDPAYEGLDGCIPPLTTANMTDQQARNVRTAYAAEVTLVDAWIGYLLKVVEEKGLPGNTLIVFTSDHGCMLGEQGEIHKGADRLRNQCTRVPLLIRHPKGDAAGVRVTDFVQHQDIMPTVLALMGLEIPERVLGRSAWPGSQPGGQTRDYVVTAFGDHASIRTKKWNYLQPWKQCHGSAPGRYELYDLERDPQELRNVIEDHRETANDLVERLQHHIRHFKPLTCGSFQSSAEADEGMSFSALPSLVHRTAVTPGPADGTSDRCQREHLAKE
jgi:arylsulfatase A-like enzyme